MMQELPANNEEAIKYIIEFYANNALSKDTNHIYDVYTKLAKKKFKMGELQQILGSISKHVHSNVNYLKTIDQVDFTYIEIILNEYIAHVDFEQDDDDVITMIKLNLDQDYITYDAARILYCLYKEMCSHSKKHVLQIVVFLIHQKMNIKSIVFNEVTIANKNDIEWYLWKMLFIYSATLSKSIHNYVSYHMKLYSLSWNKKSKLSRANILLHTFALITSKNVKKYLPDQKGIVTTDRFNYLYCYTPINEQLMQEVSKDRELYTKDLNAIATQYQPKVCVFSSVHYTSQPM